MEHQNDVVGKPQLEIKVISAKDLWSFNFFQKLCVYAVASLNAADDSPHHLSKDQMQEHRTPTDPAGDGHPEWNHPMSFLLSDLPSPSDLFLRFDLRHHAGILFPDRTIGEVRVPLSDLLDSPSPGTFRFVDYQVRSPDGKPNGVLRFAYTLNRSLPNADSDDLPPRISGYPQISDQSDKPPPFYPAADSDDLPARNSGYPQISDKLDKPPPLYPSAADLSPLPADEACPAVHQNHAPAPLPQHQYPTPPPPPPMWPPPPPPPPYWAPPGFMHRRPPPPPPPHPGYFYQGWGYQRPTEGQRNNGR